MKCLKCRRDMQRIQIEENKFVWRCPNCGNEIGRKEK